jgi:hypothetical protein
MKTQTQTATHTPRTDTEYARHPVLDTQTGGAAVRISLPRQLELENADLLAALDGLAGIFDREDRGLHDFTVTELLDALTVARAAIAKAKGGAQ